MIPTGPELDLEVARNVFNHVVMMDDSGPRLYYPKSRSWKPVPQYSSDAELAHQIRQMYRAKKWLFHVNSFVASDASQTWEAQLVHPTHPTVFLGTGSTLP